MSTTSRGWTAVDAPEQTGRTALVTGASGGLGLEVAGALAGLGAHVLLACRSPERGAAALRTVQERAGHSGRGGGAEVVALDVADLASVRACADEVRQRVPGLDVVVLNAGVMATPYGTTVDGFETQLGTNYLGHHALAARLWPAVAAAPAARVVWVTSFARFGTRHVRLSDLDPGPDAYDPWQAYSVSKLADAVAAAELARRLVGAPGAQSSVMAHPGYTHTELQHTSAREQGGAAARFFSASVRRVGMDVADGARSLLRAALDPEVRSGQVVGPRFITHGRPVAGEPEARVRDVDAGRRQWALAERATGVPFPVQGGPPATLS